MQVAKVIVNLSLDRHFDYLIPNDIADKVKAGIQVLVPFGKTERRGYVVGIDDASGYDPSKLKYISGICDKHPEIPNNLIRLARWISEYYCCSQEQAVRTLLPTAVRSGKISQKHSKHYTITSPEKVREFIFETGKRAKAKIKILEYLIQHPASSLENILENTGVKEQNIRQLLKSGLIEEEKRAKFRNIYEAGAVILPSVPPSLTDEQDNALKIIQEVFEGNRRVHTVLLHGVTGSGKTEVYMRAIEIATKKGLSAIVLVPEISLTPQTTERFMARFGENVSVLHSGLTDGERYNEWMKIHRGLVKIVVGARSALFAPFKNLGLIIVDEEHESSYKQDETPRYNARDVAVMRGKMENAVVILGSATPSFESNANALSGKYALARLHKRIDNRQMPRIIPIDMKAEMLSSKDNKAVVFSKELLDAISLRLQRAEQTIIFLNRRGYATQMLCTRCGFVAQCPNCSVTYTYHRKNECLACHVCGSMIRAYRSCPQCGDEKIRYKGLGTEKIEGMLAGIFPQAKIGRMDADTMAGKRKNYEKMLASFSAGKIDILIGTQMIAKGLDFPNVTLVGIVLADLSLFLPDFRSAERTFQLLTQVAGRAGRGTVPGDVYIQTYAPNNPAIQYAVRNDYDGFFQEEFEIRKKFGYPPCLRMGIVHFKGPESLLVAKFADEFLEALRPFIPAGMLVSGPSPSPLEKVKNYYRYMIMLRGQLTAEFRSHLKDRIIRQKRPKDVYVYADIDPLNLM